ncbi:Scr1 family TA system antitoxin-like transcriptional regulator [Actinophytocola gossypii]|uniref:Helix-turn-helix transcriptional regulator n=1 Tax=Actinophytocola gossypii TaxID=2812003 RepID=A0ABT2J174_9PSEU|nr:Scr1 family TA system antitoxin-like transcriptional regulator [Actinophytocola gossypii]MCT2581607.1 helix-turn-helix transcriptional regulator [Actinophytocola gossypii]
MPSSSPTVAGWELVLRLRERREQLGVEVRKITDALGFSRNYWSAVENERKTLSEESLVRLLELLEFDEDDTRELLALRDASRQRGWWTRYSSLFDTDLQRLFGLEHGAESIRGYESLLIPGLLQTADYARAIMTPSVTVRRVEVDQRVEVRLRRQERLTGENPLRLTAIISEAALRQQIGGPVVLRAQLDHLARTIEERADNIEVLVIPFTAVSCGLFGAATIHLLDFANVNLPTVVWQETVSSWGIIDSVTQVRDIAISFDEARRHTLNREDSLSLIHRSTKELA